MNQIFLTDDGSHSLISEAFGETYHSKSGAIEETQFVYLEAGLAFVTAQNLTEINILEVGFGTGLNALMTFREAERQGLKVNYFAYEAFPISIEQAQQLNYADKLGMNPQIFHDIHAADWGEMQPLSNFFNIQKFEKTFDQIDYQNLMHLIYFDAFDPKVQPELWDETMMQRMFNALKPNGILTTYSAKGSVKRALRSVGFQVELLPGPPSKRHITRAIKILRSQSVTPT